MTETVYDWDKTTPMIHKCEACSTSWVCVEDHNHDRVSDAGRQVPSDRKTIDQSLVTLTTGT